jgi:4-hydroxy-3-polyprenylbenzoate decarboxylase
LVEGASWEEDIGMATEVLHHAIKRAPAVCFDTIPGFARGYRVPVNAFGSQRRIAYTLGLDPYLPMQELIQDWRARMEEHQPLPARVVSDGPVMENVHTGDEVHVLAFPTPRWHDADGGRYIGTGSMDITRDPETGVVNLGTYRVMVHNEKQVGFYISPGKHGRIHREKWFARGEPCPVAVVVGQDPLLFLASCTEVPFGLSEFDWT